MIKATHKTPGLKQLFERATKNGQSRETANTGHTRRRKTHNTICVGDHYMPTNTNNATKT